MGQRSFFHANPGRTDRRAVARIIAFGFVAVHAVLLVAYTFPAEQVPVRLRFWSQAYARVLFHQDWRLFAPDPPACGCTLQVKGTDDGAWTDLSDQSRHFIWQRMCANACRYAEAGLAPGASTVNAPLPLTRTLETMAEQVPRKGPLLVRMMRCEEALVTIELVAHR
ncbi:MAG: hypothetical protein IPJ76_12680 [Flavobacteriales bacterium]|nr:MAG: hypothetical protein IPJ76_12680 [Flavobacteriales bacterium]